MSLFLPHWQKMSPGWVDFGVGQPHKEMLPSTEVLLSACKHRFSAVDNGEYDIRSMMQYGHDQGCSTFREILAKYLSDKYGSEVLADDLLITNGSSLGLDLICSTLTEPGQTVIVEHPSYFLAFKVFTDNHCNVVPIASVDTGIDLSALESALKEHKPSLFYCIPTYNNPKGNTWSEEHRKAVASLCDQYNCAIVSDDVYQLLGFEGTPPLPFVYHSQNALSLGSFSKLLGPGIRLGYIHTKNKKHIETLLGKGYIRSGGGLNPFTGSIMQSLIEQGLLDQHIQMLKQTLDERLKVMCKALKEKLPECRVIEPKGGYFVWVECPEGTNTRDLLRKARAEDRKVAFTPGYRCSPLDESSTGMDRFLRLSFAYHTSEEILVGIDRLSVLVRGQ